MQRDCPLHLSGVARAFPTKLFSPRFCWASNWPPPIRNFVGLNLVEPEDWYIPTRDFNEHMAMLDYLHGLYPKVHISLHAGELAMGLVRPEDLASTFVPRSSAATPNASGMGFP